MLLDALTVTPARRVTAPLPYASLVQEAFMLCLVSSVRSALLASFQVLALLCALIVSMVNIPSRERVRVALALHNMLHRSI